MTTLREAAMALLEQYDKTPTSSGCDHYLGPELDALRAALAEAERERKAGTSKLVYDKATRTIREQPSGEVKVDMNPPQPAPAQAAEACGWANNRGGYTMGAKKHEWQTGEDWFPVYDRAPPAGGEEVEAERKLIEAVVEEHIHGGDRSYYTLVSKLIDARRAKGGA